MNTVFSLGMEVLRLSLWLVLLAAIFVPIERLFGLRPARILRPAILADLGYYFMSSLIPGFVLGLPLALLATGAHRVMPWPIQDSIAHWPLWLSMVVGLVLGEVGAYWGHRWSHEIPYLWRFHSVHHEPEHMDWLVNTRAHPVDMVLTRLCALVPLYVLGLGGPGGAEGSVVPAVVLIVGSIWGFFVHANLRFRFGLFEQVFATPAFHHWHHTQSGPINRNYSAMLPWMDRLFGTFHLPRGAWPDEYGIDHAAEAAVRTPPQPAPPQPALPQSARPEPGGPERHRAIAGAEH